MARPTGIDYESRFGDEEVPPVCTGPARRSIRFPFKSHPPVKTRLVFAEGWICPLCGQSISNATMLVF